MLCSYWEKHNWQTVKAISRSIYLKVWVCLLPFASIVAEVVSSYEEMMELISRGQKNRHVGETDMNKDSSRSHSVLTAIIKIR